MAQCYAIQFTLKFMSVSVSWLWVEVIAQGPTCLARPQLKSNVFFILCSEGGVTLNIDRVDVMNVVVIKFWYNFELI